MPRLTDLNPRWCRFGDAPEGAKQGVNFLCPHCRARYIGVWFDVPICGSSAVNLEHFQAALTDSDHPDYDYHKDIHWGTVLHWHREGDTFDTLTLTPSIDASKFGCWHGFVTAGECT